MSRNEDWADEKQKNIDLQLENRNLEMEIELMGGGIFGKSDDLDPKIENEFLKHVIAFEEAENAPQISLFSLFPDDYQFPPAESMSPEQLTEKLDDISDILAGHNILLSFMEDLPDFLLYKHVVEELIPNERVHAKTIPGSFLHFDGCTGFCEECFQREYCSDLEEDDS